MRLAASLGLLLAGGAYALANTPVEAPEATYSYNYKEDLPRVGVVFSPAEGAELNTSTGDQPWEVANRVEVKRSAEAPVSYSIVPAKSGILKYGFIYDHSGGTPRQIAKLSLGERTSKPGFVVEITRGLFGLENSWCGVAVGDHSVSLFKAAGDERPLASDTCVDLFSP